MTFALMVLAAWSCFMGLIFAAESPKCPANSTEIIVKTPADAYALASALNCTGSSSFVVTWVGNVIVTRSIIVSGGSSLAVTGSGWMSSAVGYQTSSEASSIIDGGDAIGICIVHEGSTISLQDIVIQQGIATNGGAIAARSSILSSRENTITITNCLFLRNNGNFVGGEMHDTIIRIPSIVALMP